MSANDVIETYIKLHEGKICKHWLWAAIERVVAGDNEADVMRDFGFVSERLLKRAVGDLNRLGTHSSAPGNCTICTLVQSYGYDRSELA